MSSGALAIVGPSFFSYLPAIAAEFERRGIGAIVYDERHSNRIIDKIFYRLGVYRSPLSPKHRHLRKIAKDIAFRGCRDVLLVDVEVVDRTFVRALTDEGIHVHLYMWDSARNKPRFTSYLDLVTSSGTFDPVDRDQLNMTYVPLFAEPLFNTAPQHDGISEFDIGFCGTVHSSRTAILAKLVRARRRKPLRLDLMLYYHSRALFAFKGLKDWNVWSILKLVRDEAFSKQEIAIMFSRTACVLDVPHPGQTGLTARTFEVLLAGARLLTFNRNAAELLPPSLQSRIVIVDDVQDVLDLDFANFGPLPLLDDSERYYLSLQRFVDQLVGMMDLGVSSKAKTEDQSRPARAGAAA